MKRVVLMAVLGLPFALGAQSRDTTADRLGPRGREFWAGYSAHSPKWGVLGNRPGLSFALAAARFTHRISARDHYALDYTLDIVPIAMSSPPLAYQDEDGNAYPSAGPSGSCVVSVFGCRFPSGSAFGAGISPLGVTAVYRRDRALQPRIGVTGGVLFFDRRVPTVVSTRLNFTATLEAGLQLLNRSGDGLLLVYRFHHLSNAGTGHDNSALASHVISVGARVRARGGR